MSESISEAVDGSVAGNLSEPQVEPIATDFKPQTAPPAGPQAAGESAAPASASDADLKPAIGLVLNMPFALIAQRTGCDAINLDEKECNDLTVQADQVMRTYFPQIASAKEATIVAFALSLGMISIGKYGAYVEWKKEKAEKKQKPEPAQAMPEPFPVEQARGI
jgi:hypothetical protein